MDCICSERQIAKNWEQGRLPPQSSQAALHKCLLEVRNLAGCCPHQSLLWTGDLTRGFDRYSSWQWVKPREFHTSSLLTKTEASYFLPCLNKSEKKALDLWEYMQKGRETFSWRSRVIVGEWNDLSQEIDSYLGKRVSLKDPRNYCLYKENHKEWKANCKYNRGSCNDIQSG